MNVNKLAHLLATVALCGSTAVQAQSSWDGVGNFSIGANANGAWSYRVRAADGSLSLMGYSNANCRGTPGLACWNTDAGDWDLPMIGLNTSGAEIVFPSGVIPLSTLNMHPGADGDRPVLTFTAPGTGWYRVTGQFQMVDRTPTGVQVTVSQDATTLVDKPLTLFGQTVQFNLKRKLNAGQTVNFSVDAAGNFANDSTELKVAVLRLD